MTKKSHRIARKMPRKFCNYAKYFNPRFTNPGGSKRIIKDIKNKLTARGFERRTSELAATERANHSAKFSDENRKNLNTESMDMLIS